MPRQPRAGTRRQARTVALQTLYESDLAGHEPLEVLQRHVEDRRLDESVASFAGELVEGVVAHQEEIDARIQEAAPEWPLAQMARIDKNILRLAIYEILYNNAVPARAAINEAVELAKRFGGDTSSRFVNGVLGAIAGQSIEPPPSPAGSEEPLMSTMSREEILTQLKPVVAEQLGVDESEVREDASFTEDLNADSLDLVELIMSLEEKFGLQISDEDAEKLTTVGEAVEFISEHVK